MKNEKRLKGNTEKMDCTNGNNTSNSIWYSVCVCIVVNFATHLSVFIQVPIKYEQNNKSKNNDNGHTAQLCSGFVFSPVLHPPKA